MATINSGITIKPPLGGQRCDLDPGDVTEDYARYLRNWVKRGGKFIVRPGFTQVGASLGAYATGAIQYDHQSGDKFSVIATGTKWFKYDLATRDWVDITDAFNPLTGGEGSHQLFRVFYQSNKAFVVGVNGYEDAPKCWDGVTANYEDVGGDAPKARCLAVCNNRLLLGNTYTTQANRHQIDVSNFNNFRTGWTAVQTVNLMDTPGEIVTINELGNLAAAVYKTDSVYMCNAQESTEPFAFELTVPEIKGPASPRCVVPVPGAHIIMAYDGSFWSFNGTSPTVLPDALTQHVVQTADVGMLSRAFGFYDAPRQEVWFIYRGKGSAYMNEGLIINLADNSVWPLKFLSMYPTAGLGARLQESTRIGDLVQRIGELSDPIKDWAHFYDRILLVDSIGRVTTENEYTDGSPVVYMSQKNFGDGYCYGQPDSVVAEVETLLMKPAAAVEDGNYRQYFTAVESEHFFNKTSTPQPITVQLGYSHRGEDPQYTAERSIDLSSNKLVLGHRTTSRAFCLRLTAVANTMIQWKGSVVNGVGRGLK